jgi:uncharacterized protein Yka (UPF0111/DUF47 family)
MAESTALGAFAEIDIAGKLNDLKGKAEAATATVLDKVNYGINTAYLVIDIVTEVAQKVSGLVKNVGALIVDVAKVVNTTVNDMKELGASTKEELEAMVNEVKNG